MASKPRGDQSNACDHYLDRKLEEDIKNRNLNLQRDWISKQNMWNALEEKSKREIVLVIKRRRLLNRNSTFPEKFFSCFRTFAANRSNSFALLKLFINFPLVFQSFRIKYIKNLTSQPTQTYIGDPHSHVLMCIKTLNESNDSKLWKCWN